MERPVLCNQGGRVSPTTCFRAAVVFMQAETLRAQSAYQVFAAAAFAIGPTNGGCGLEPCRKRIGCSAHGHAQSSWIGFEWRSNALQAVAWIGRERDLSIRVHSIDNS